MSAMDTEGTVLAAAQGLLIIGPLAVGVVLVAVLVGVVWWGRRKRQQQPPRPAPARRNSPACPTVARSTRSGSTASPTNCPRASTD
ncbi:hypothetical protein FNV64_11430 [Streptomyces sp. S1A1-7]|nr:hypothetical protein FNV64_11430 [Streptomyces sp. S1A1-7]